MSGSAYYFAYGSNMHSARMRARIPFAVPVETAALAGHALCFDKRGRDGSAKCNIRPDVARQVRGVVFRIDGLALILLDRIEGSGYRRLRVSVTGANSGRRYRAHCYSAKSTAVDPRVVAFDWYVEFVVSGAEAHGLPAQYVDWLRSAASRPDPNHRRGRQQRTLLMCRGIHVRRGNAGI